jgi:MSHA biogenesis protein MshP
MKTPRGASASFAQRGLGAVAAIVVLVVLAVIAAAVVRLSTSQQTGVAQQLQAARAAQAAQAGIEWGLYQALRNSSCGSSTLDLSADLGMRVSVSCSVFTYNEGESAEGVAQPRRVYTIDATACNSTACPDAARATGPHYVERRRVVSATDG